MSGTTSNETSAWSRWPEVLREYLQTRYGEPTTITRLSGLGHNAIWKAEFESVTWIVKRSREINFYRKTAPELQRQGVPTVALEWSDVLEDGEWFVVEFIPNPLPRERWMGDPAVMHALHSLHTSQLPAEAVPDVLFKPRWNDWLTQTALTFFPEDDAYLLRPRFKRLQVACQALFEPRGWISGDPNAMNWGVREDGAVVLFDWERFGRGTPAIDLAITMPAMPTKDDFERVAQVYRQYDADETQNAQLAHELALAKVWNVVEFLGTIHAGGISDTRALTWIREHFPTWVKDIHG